MNSNTIRRFLSKIKIEDTGCWIWTASTVGGYGCFLRNKYAHRFSYEYFYDVIPEGLCVLHHCDNHLCVNPEHLFLGTQEDNMRDMVEKGRSTFGEKHPKAKLTESDVVHIREMYDNGIYTQKEIAKKYEISKSSVSCIVRCVNWSHI